jgi:hypothetical protein
MIGNVCAIWGRGSESTAEADVIKRGEGSKGQAMGQGWMDRQQPARRENLKILWSRRKEEV